MGPKLGMILSYITTALGAFLLWKYFDDTNLLFVFIILLNFGINVAFQIVYIIGVKIIPSIFAARAFGVTNVCARTFTILSPLMAEVDYPVPEFLIIGTCAVAAVFMLLVVEKLPK